MAQSLSRICIHIVFGTKDRRALITDAVREDLHKYMAGALRRINCKVIAVNSVEDHAHILFALSRDIPPSKAAEHVKTASSKWIKTKGAEFASFAWQSGYGAFSVSPSRIDAVCGYIAKQREHHRRESFRDEYRKLLVRNKADFDERYFLD